jgi:hypothetical protein
MKPRFLKSRKYALVALLILLAPLGLRAQTTVSGTLKDPGGNPMTSGNDWARFTLQNYSSNIPKVIGTNVIVPPYADFKPNGSGAISGTIQANNSITPSGTFYRVCIFHQGQTFQCNNYTINGASFDLDSATPNSVNPVATPPTGDNTYWRLDGGNSPNGSLIPAANGSQSVGNSSARWNGFFNTLDVSGSVTGLVPSARAVNTAAPLSGGGALSSDVTISLANQSANTVLAGPSSGAAAAPNFRALVSADIPAIDLAASGNGGVTGILPVASEGSGTPAAGKYVDGGTGAWTAIPSTGAQVSTQTSTATNFGVALGSQTVVSSFPATGVAYVFSNVVESTLGVGCSTATNTVSITWHFTAPGGTAESPAESNNISMSGNGALDGGSSVNNAASTPAMRSYAVKSGSSLTYTTASTLASTGCTTTPQYTVYVKVLD